MGRRSIGKTALILVCLFPLAVALKVGAGRSNPSPVVTPIEAAPVSDKDEKLQLLSHLPSPDECPDVVKEARYPAGRANAQVFLRAARQSPDLVKDTVQTYRDACRCKSYRPIYVLDGENTAVIDKMLEGYITLYIEMHIENAMLDQPASDAEVMDRAIRKQVDLTGAVVSMSGGKYNARKGYERLKRYSEPTRDYAPDTAQCVMSLAGAPMRGLESAVED